MGGAASISFEECSPIKILQRIQTVLEFPPTVLVHHIDDTTVPFTSSVELEKELRNKDVLVTTLLPKVRRHSAFFRVFMIINHTGRSY